MDKRTMRLEVLQDFAKLPPRKREAWSEEIAERVMALPEVRAARGPWMAFLSMENELDTEPLIRRVLDAGITLYMPRTDLRGRRLLPTRLTSLDAVRRGTYGIREPVSGETIDPSELALVIVPAVAFDRRGMRLGRGGGFYDRFIEKLAPEAVTCGVCFSRYLFDRVPTEPHDKAVRIVVTDREVLRPGAGGPVK